MPSPKRLTNTHNNCGRRRFSPAYIKNLSTPGCYPSREDRFFCYFPLPLPCFMLPGWGNHSSTTAAEAAIETTSPVRAAGNGPAGLSDAHCPVIHRNGVKGGFAAPHEHGDHPARQSCPDGRSQTGRRPVRKLPLPEKGRSSAKGSAWAGNPSFSTHGPQEARHHVQGSGSPPAWSRPIISPTNVAK